ncbi:hypothetical protein MKY09_17940 [Psychrobacillus sp. FSL K6-4046]|uniref:hypothetical protein n=1 Tax=unclassified Psychrobacillus TaxID=2636677 RepID=UPI00203EB7BF|nr:hypothetical protein [Psychrobacillus sp. MER TA 171]MCM3357415.1 hypothetical protein [Psychrobacillus sp. MER TA 171]
MKEEDQIFRAFLRSHIDWLLEVQIAIKEKDLERAEELIDKVIKQAKNTLED